MNSHRDVEYSRNNCFLAVRLVSAGRLKLLQQNLRVRIDNGVDEGDPRVWVFGNLVPWQDDAGNDRICHHLRGLLTGTIKEGEDFLQCCETVGLEVEYGNFFVPLSNGEKYVGCCVACGPVEEYPKKEQALVRCDRPPSLQEMIEILGQRGIQ